jgi:hypothetical protein
MTEPGVDPVSLDGVYAVSDDVVAREIEGEIVIVPLVAGVGDADDELYSLNETGAALWRKLDGVRPLRSIAADLADEFEATLDVIERDVVGLVDELVDRRIVVAVPPA